MFCRGYILCFNGLIRDQYISECTEPISPTFQDRYVHGWVWSTRPSFSDRARDIWWPFFGTNRRK